MRSVRCSLTTWLLLLQVPFVAVACAAHGPAAASSLGPSGTLQFTRVGRDHYVLAWAVSGDRIVGFARFGSFLTAPLDGTVWRETPIIIAEDWIPPGETKPLLEPRPIMDDLVAIAVLDDGTLIGVGSNGESSDTSLIRSTNGGLGWTRPAPKPFGPAGALARSGRTLILAGEAGMLARSMDGGASWALAPRVTDLLIFGVALTPSGHAVAIGEQGVVLRSDDDGVTWKGRSFGRQPLFAIAMLEDGRAWIAGATGTVLASGDACRSVRSVGIGDDNSATRLPALDVVTARVRGPQTIVAVGGEQGTLLVGDGTGEWARQTIGDGSATITALLFASDSLFVATDAGEIYRAEVPD